MLNPSPTTSAVRFEAVRKSYGTVNAVDGVDLAIADGEFFTLLGPSGSGKTTCLRLIAGFESPSAGRIYLHDANVSSLPPYERDVNTVFQDYALFPHMTVAENVEYGLMVRKVNGAERARKVGEVLELVHLEGLGARRPTQLSGGQRQRVALARALVNEPSVLLLDEPLGALDLKLRQAMQVELKHLQRTVGITFVFVTHDQEEALTMSDRIAVFNHGKAEQVGTPTDVYESPTNTFVAGFVGTSNVIAGELASLITGRADAFTVRPEKIKLWEVDGDSESSAAVAGACRVEGTLVETEYLGMFSRYRVEVGDQILVAVSQNVSAGPLDQNVQPGRRVTLTWSEASCRPIELVPEIGEAETSPMPENGILTEMGGDR